MNEDKNIRDLTPDEEDQEFRKPIYHILPITLDVEEI